MCKTKTIYEFSIELNGKICGKTSDLNEAMKFARNLGRKAIVFCGPIVVED